MKRIPKSILSFVILFLVACQFLSSMDSKQAKEQIKEIKAWVQTHKYPLPPIQSEEAFEKVILFINEPIKYARTVNTLDDHSLWAYITLYDQFMYESKRAADGFYSYEKLRNATRTLDSGKVTLVTYLIISLRCEPGIHAEVFIGLYTELFGQYPSLFMKDLAKRQNWKQVIDMLASGDYQAMKAGLAKLGDSGFERELKDYWAECEKRWTSKK